MINHIRNKLIKETINKNKIIKFKNKELKNIKEEEIKEKIHNIIIEKRKYNTYICLKKYKKVLKRHLFILSCCKILLVIVICFTLFSIGKVIR